MARQNRVRDELVAQAKARRRAAGQKVSRLERRGVRVRKEGLDPREGVSPFDYSKMSARQLRQHIRQLDRFTSRGNGFVAGRGGTPIERSTWNAIQRAQRAVNAQARAFQAANANVIIPGTGRSLEAVLEDQVRVSKWRAAGQHKTFETTNKTPGNIEGQEGAEATLKNLQNMMKPGYLNKRMRAQRATVMDMLGKTGDAEIAAQVRKLSNEQLLMLVDYGDFMKALGGRYAHQKSLNTVEKLRPEDEWQYSEYEDNLQRLKETVGWASSLPKKSRDTDNRPTNWNPSNTNAGPINIWSSTNAGPIDIYNSTKAGPIPTQRGKWNADNTNAGPVPTQKPKRNRKRKND